MLGRVWSQLVCRGTRLARGIAAGTVAQRNAVQVTGRRVPRPLAGARPGPLAASRRRAGHGGARGAGDASGAVGAAAAILIASTIFDSHSEPSVLVRLASGALERGEYDEVRAKARCAGTHGSLVNLLCVCLVSSGRHRHTVFCSRPLPRGVPTPTTCWEPSTSRARASPRAPRRPFITCGWLCELLCVDAQSLSPCCML